MRGVFHSVAEIRFGEWGEDKKRKRETKLVYNFTRTTYAERARVFSATVLSRRQVRKCTLTQTDRRLLIITFFIVFVFL